MVHVFQYFQSYIIALKCHYYYYYHHHYCHYYYYINRACDVNGRQERCIQGFGGETGGKETTFKISA